MPMKQAQNVVRMNQNSVFADIQTFLRNKEVKSKNTMTAYDADIRQFFKYMRGKEIEELTVQDLNFRNSDMMNYQTYLYREYTQPNGKRYSNITINRKINAIVSLYRFLKRNGYDVDPEVIRVEDLPDDSKQIGFLTLEEINHLLALADNEELKAFIVLALHTSMRKNALLNLKWEQIERKYDEPDYYVIRVMDKGKQDFKDIHSSVYEMLLNIKTDDERVFTMPTRTLDYRFKVLCKKAGIDEKRKVSIHSLRKAGIDFVKQFTGDLQAAQNQASHSSPSVTAAIYTQQARNLAARILVDHVDEKIFDELTRDELLELVKSFGNGIGFQLRNAAKKIIEKRKG